MLSCAARLKKSYAIMTVEKIELIGEEVTRFYMNQNMDKWISIIFQGSGYIQRGSKYIRNKNILEFF